MMSKLRFVLSSSLLVLFFSLAALAQTGSIQGTVTDKSGAVVQDAQVTVRNLQTNATREVRTSGTGAYSIPNLTVGTYEITVQKEGFRAFKVGAAQLTVDQAMTANAELEPGAVSEEVQVQGNELPPVDLETAQVSNLVDSKQMQDLPLITRDPYSLVLLSPGTSQTNSGLGGFTVNGSRERNNNFMLDGVDNNDTSVPGIPDGLLSANPDSTEEFRVITNNFNAEYGRNTGAIIDVVTKSGTNNFHGGVYEFGRWNSFGGARDWFNPRVNSDGSLNPMNPYTRNQFGFSFGGPIRKNKTFFFVNTEFDRYRTTLTNSAVVPTAAFKTGVFTYNGTPIDLTQQPGTDPFNCPAAPTNNNAFCLPLDPTMQKIFALYPNPTSSADGLSGVAFFPSSSKTDSYAPVVKIDHQFTNSESLSMRYSYNHFFDPNPFHADILPGNVGGVSSKAITQGAAANLTSTLKPTLVNNFTFGWNKLYDTFGCTGLDVLDSVSPLDAFGNGIDYLFDAPFTNFGCLSLVSNGQWRKTGTTSFGDNLTWVHGAHTFKFGSDFRNIGEQGPNSFFSRRELSMSTFITSTGLSLMSNAPANDSLALENAAIALYGFVGEDFAGEFFNKSGVREGTDNKHFRQHEYDWYGQDTWKVRRNLTLNLGVRYQLDGVPYEENANFSNLLADPSSFQAGQDVVMTVVGPGTGHSLYKQDYSNIEPRVGLSWDPRGDGKTAIRAAFGIFHDRVFGNLFGNARGNPPFEQDYLHFPFETINNAFQGTFGGETIPSVVPDQPPSPVIADDSQLAPVLFDTHFRNTVSNNWNIGIQRELAGNNVIDLAYVASEGHYIPRQRDGNPPDPALVNQLVAYCSDPSNSLGCTPDEVSGILLYEGGQGPNDFGILPFNAVANNAMVQPFYQVSVTNSIYNSLQAKFTHRISHGVQLQASYTWAHAIDDGADPLVPAAGNRTFPRNSRDLHQDRGNSDNDVRHVAVINYIWELPFGRGKAYLSNGALGKVFEGMQLSGITTVQTGHPFEIRSQVDSQRTGISAWGNLVGDPYAAPSDPSCAPDTSGGGKGYFKNICAFAEPTVGSGPGTIGRNQFYGPGLVDFDLSFAKKSKLTERLGLEFRVEAYNIFNHPHFTNPGADASNLGNLLDSGLFGVITSTVSRSDGTTSARQLQVALKLNF
jgi:Carboxypeptidase regulatory-like domain/TonB dependent receptor